MNTGTYSTSPSPSGGIYASNLYSPITASATNFGTIATRPSHFTVDGKLNVSDDIVISGRSLNSILERIEQRLYILQYNVKLEERWQELKELGDRYRELEQKLTEKEKVWEILKTP